MIPEVERLLELASGVPSEARAEILARESANPNVRAEVAALLRYADEAESYFDHAVQQAASSLITGLEPAPGEVIGSYRLVMPIGKGGMGTVYLAERADGEIEQRVAIKLLRAEGLRAGWRERFLKERQLLASLDHPSVVHVIDAGHTGDGRPFLVMEYVDGMPIDRYAARIGVKERLKLFIQVCEGVSHAHRRLIIHRDLKPSNILVDQMGRPKLLDFGIAKLLNDAGDVTQIAEQLLTPNYASPEQLRGAAQSTATDVYSLGAVLYKLLTGAAPRENSRKSPNGELAPPSRLNPEAPKDLDFVVAQALRPEPELRYASVDELARDVRAVLELRPVAARGGDVWYRLRKQLRHYWAPAAAALLIVTSLSAGLWMANRERRIAERERQLAERRFTDVRQLADKLFDIDVQVAQLPGGSKARQLIVDTALEYLRRVTVDVRMEPDLALDLGTAYMRVARVEGVNISTNLGQTAQAQAAEQKAQALIDSVLAAQPSNRMALLRAGQIAHDRMILAGSGGHADQVLHFADVSVEQLNRFLAARPLNATSDHMDAQQAIIAFINVANQYMKAGRFEETGQTAARAIALARATNWPAQAGAALIIVAMAHRATGELEEALQAIRESVRLLEPEKGETRTGKLLPYGLALIREGQILGEEQAISLNRPEEAMALIRQGLEGGEDLARRDPADFSSQYRVFSAETKLAAILRHSEPARALALYDDALHRLAGMAANGSAVQDEAETLSASVYPLLQLGRIAEARRRLDGAFERLNRLHQYPAAQVELGSPADAALRALAESQAAAGDVRGGAAQYAELLRLILAAHPNPETRLEDAVRLSNLYGAAARVERLAGHADSAAGLETSRLKLWQAWDDRRPGNAFVKRQMAMARH